VRWWSCVLQQGAEGDHAEAQVHQREGGQEREPAAGRTPTATPERAVSDARVAAISTGASTGRRSRGRSVSLTRSPAAITP
jgi:hypothetical protein